jgi:hypothetical protein
MLSRNATTISQVSQRSAAMRRQLHRHAWGRQAARNAPYCPTNGCASFMEVDEQGIARCPICGAQRRVR